MSLLENIVGTGALYRDRGRAVPLRRSIAVKDTPSPLLGRQQLVVQNRPQMAERAVLDGADFEHQIFNSLVALKVAVSNYAMHLSRAERHRIFDALDSLINVDDWHEGDTLPNVIAFRDFLKWMIYSRYFKWTSFGVSNEGRFLVAWKTDRVLLTAAFSGMTGQEGVRWTAEVKSDHGEIGYIVGKCPLRMFAGQAVFYLGGAGNGAEQNSG